MMHIIGDMDEESIVLFRQSLSAWYKVAKRDLPWRHTCDAYRIWVSEVILQQTRVEQALDYYAAFVERFPTVRHLARASEQEVLNVWKGLGYYSRARNMHQAAKDIVQQCGGEFPCTYDAVRALKGVGDYTAAAVCSFAYGLKYAVVDGNVYRFLARYLGIEEPIDSTAGKRLFADVAQALLDVEHTALHNQAMMEMGAIQCVKTNPRCEECCFERSCRARAMGTVALLPVKQGRTKVRERYFYYFLIRYGDGIFMCKRAGNDVWRGLYEFPLIETDSHLEPVAVLQQERVAEIVGEGVIMGVTKVRKHVLSHQRIYAYCIYVEVAQLTHYLREKCEFVPLERLDLYPTSRLVERFLDEYLEI